MPETLLMLHVLPLAIGAALSPTILTVQILVLSSGEGSLARAWGLTAGRLVALLLLSFGGISLLALLPDFDSGQPSGFQAALMAAAGAVLLLVAVREWSAPPRQKRGPSFAARFERAGPVSLFVVGLFWMFVNVSTLALYVPALHVITNSNARIGAKAVTFLFLLLCASAVALVPTMAVTFYGDRARPYLDDIHRWVDANSHLIAMGMSGVLGVALIVVGLQTFVSL